MCTGPRRQACVRCRAPRRDAPDRVTAQSGDNHDDPRSNQYVDGTADDGSAVDHDNSALEDHDDSANDNDGLVNHDNRAINTDNSAINTADGAIRAADDTWGDKHACSAHSEIEAEIGRRLARVDTDKKAAFEGATPNLSVES